MKNNLQINKQNHQKSNNNINNIKKIGIIHTKNKNENAKYNSLNNNNNLLSQNRKNNNKNFIENINKNNDLSNSINSSISIDVYEKNISLLNEKIKEQEKDIRYLNNRLQNYDITLNEITNLNIELNTLNEIIRKKNKTIQEFRDISDLSKKKFEELLNNNNNLLKKIDLLEEENKKLAKNNVNNNYINSLKDELNKVNNERDELKRQITEKDKEIDKLKKIIDDFNNKNDSKENYNENKALTYTMNREKPNDINDYKYNNDHIKVNKNLINRHLICIKKPKINSLVNKKKILEGRYTPLNMNKNLGLSYNINQRNNNYLYNKSFSIKTEPSHSSYGNLNSTFNLKERHNYYKNKYSLQPLDYSNFLLDNLKSNICKNYY